jgi:hypothetical protein
VLGQVLRYMGWVKANLAKENEKVGGIIIVGEEDKALNYVVFLSRPTLRVACRSVRPRGMAGGANVQSGRKLRGHATAHGRR